MTGIECKIGGLTLKTFDIYRLEYEACANQPTRLSVRVEAAFTKSRNGPRRSKPWRWAARPVFS